MIENSLYMQQKASVVASLGWEVLLGPSTRKIDFSELSAYTQTHQNLLYASPEDLQRSFDAGMSALFMDGERALGHARFIPLVDDNLKRSLELGDQMPQIWEMGTGIMLENNSGVNTYLRVKLYDRYIEQMRERRLLIIGTTKSPALRGIVDRLAEETNLDFRFCHRCLLPMVATFTCICNPDFGQGFQHGSYCPQPEPEVVPGFRTGDEIPIFLDQGGKERTACTMFVSSVRLAHQTEALVRTRFPEQHQLVEALRRQRYYE